MRDVNHTRPFSSNIGLWLRVLLSQIGSGPQTGEDAIAFDFDDGVSGSRTGCSTSLAVWVVGSRIGTKSVESSGDPYTLPLALSLGLRRSVETRSCR